MEIVFTEKYTKISKAFLKQHPELFKQYEKCLYLLSINHLHPSLRLHKLKGKFKNIYSVYINMAYRITLELIIEKDRIVLINIGSHEEVY